MKFIYNILRLFVVMLFSVLGVSMTFAVPMSTSEIAYLKTETTHIAQGDDVGFAARGPPLAAANVEVTGGVTSMQGSAFALHGQETVAALFGFDRSFIAPNNGRFSGIQARNADEAMAALTALANEDYVTFGKHTSGLVLEVAIKIFAAPAAAAKLGLDGSVGLAKIGKAAGKHTGEFARDERGSVPTGRATNNADVPETVYRGDTRGPDEIFDEGLQPKNPGSDTSLEDYVDYNKPSDYVGTTTNRPTGDSSIEGSPEAFGTGHGDLDGFVYEIDRPNNDIDVNSQYPDGPFPNENEIAVPGGVDTGCIRGCTPIGPDGTSTGDFIPNPNYTGDN